MSDSPLERAHAASERLGKGTARDDVALLFEAHGDVIPLVGAAADAIEAAVELIVAVMSDGGRLLYAGAGTSGWLAALDATEVVLTFGMTGRVDSVVGGGRTLDPVSMTIGDDDVRSLADDDVMSRCGAGDVMIAVSASGQTPFTVAAAGQALAAGATVVAVVNAERSALGQLAQIAIVVPTASELVAGSTRLTAGFSQKLILNTLSTASMVRLGRVVNGHMVCVEPLNDKLRRRVVVAVAAAAGVDEATAGAALAQAGRGDVACVSLMAGVEVAEATDLLNQYGGNIGRAVAGR